MHMIAALYSCMQYSFMTYVMAAAFSEVGKFLDLFTTSLLVNARWYYTEPTRQWSIGTLIKSTRGLWPALDQAG
jgi:hypothetical protein